MIKAGFGGGFGRLSGRESRSIAFCCRISSFWVCSSLFNSSNTDESCFGGVVAASRRSIVGNSGRMRSVSATVGGVGIRVVSENVGTMSLWTSATITGGNVAVGVGILLVSENVGTSGTSSRATGTDVAV
jgi:hypothetical protein